MLYCETCGGVSVNVTVVIDEVPISGVTPVRQGSKVGTPNYNVRKMLFKLNTAQIIINHPEDHKYYVRCYECGKKIKAKVQNNKIYPDSGKLVGNVFVCDTCYEMYYENIDYDEEDSDEE